MEQKKTRNLLDEISPEDLQKIRDHKASTKGAFPVDVEWMLLAEFAKAYGWAAYMAAKNDEIIAAEMLTLIEANRKLEARQTFLDMQSAFVGAVSATQKKPTNIFKRLTKDIIKQTKVED